MSGFNVIEPAYDLEQLTKSNLSKAASFLGEKCDWARVPKDEIIAIIEGHTSEEQYKALIHIGATADDIENLRIGDAATAVSAKEAIETMMSAEVDTATPKQPTTAKNAAVQTDSDQVAQIAGLLAQVLATNKGAIDANAVREIVKGEITSLSGDVHNALKQGAEGIMAQVKSLLADLPPKKLDVTSKEGTVTVEGRQHKQFELLLKVLGSTNGEGHSNLNVWLTGMPGTGKTHAASTAAHALGMKFYCNGSIANKYELTGFKDAHGNYQSTPFRDAWENGGVYLFDEVDGSVPSAVLAFNSALANGIMAFPDGMLKRHKDCIIIAAANTSGQGATAELVGRMKQDAAFLDRFVFISWLIDEGLEQHLCQNKAWADYVQKVRKNVETKGVKVMVTPRSTIFGDQLLSGGLDKQSVIEMTLKKGMTAAQWEMVK
jgi:cobaltochelatase CobS